MTEEAKWRYEVRGSAIYDNREQRSISNAEAGEILNAHEALLLKEGVWAAKAGLAAGKTDAFQSQLTAALAERDAARQDAERWRLHLATVMPAAWFGIVQLENDGAKGIQERVEAAAADLAAHESLTPGLGVTNGDN